MAKLCLHGTGAGTVSLIIHSMQLISAVVVLGITAWAVGDTRTTTVIYSLVTVCDVVLNSRLASLENSGLNTVTKRCL
jgi:hypothetical protein